MQATGTSGLDKEACLAAAAQTQARLIRASQQADPRTRVIETHISCVLLIGRYAYKIKKPVDLGFLDFSSLEKRRHFCAEEVRLNRRLAPEIYLDVVPVTGTPSAPRLGGRGKAIEYAVRMRRFSQRGLLDRCLARNELAAEQVDALADRIAAFHDGADRLPAGAPYGSPEIVWKPMAENFRQLRHYLPAEEYGDVLDRLEAWSSAANARLRETIGTRRRQGAVRECHGDLHLGNIALVRGQPLIFDCIEFNPELRWIDVISEVAFMVMDLEERGRPDYAHRFLNRYLESTGDYAGLPLLAFYQVYRALVRAKVAAIRAGQEDPAARRRELALCGQYLAYAHRATQPAARRLILMHGFSGSGKTRVSQLLLENTGAVRLRSDVERKRLAGLSPLADSGSTVEGGIYGAPATAATYARLAELARQALSAGYAVVVDAASLKRWQRDIFRSLAREAAVPFLLVSCEAPAPLLRQRLAARSQAGGDASEADAAVLEGQMRSAEPLTEEERAHCLAVDTGQCSRDELLRRLAART